MSRPPSRPGDKALKLKNFTGCAEPKDLTVITRAMHRRYGSARQVWSVVVHDLAEAIREDPSVIRRYQERFLRRVEIAEQAKVRQNVAVDE